MILRKFQNKLVIFGDEKKALKNFGNENQNQFGNLSFEKSVPIIEYLNDINMEIQGRVYYWGSMFDAENVDTINIVFDDHYQKYKLEIHFDTSHYPPMSWLQNVSEKYKSLEFKLEYYCKASITEYYNYYGDIHIVNNIIISENNNHDTDLELEDLYNGITKYMQRELLAIYDSSNPIIPEEEFKRKIDFYEYDLHGLKYRLGQLFDNIYHEFVLYELYNTEKMYRILKYIAITVFNDEMDRRDEIARLLALSKVLFEEVWKDKMAVNDIRVIVERSLLENI